MRYLRETWRVTDSAVWLAVIRIMTGWIFLHSGWGKVTDPGFAANLPKTLGYFASNNPHAWMVSLLQTVAIPNANLFARLFSWGELVVGLSLFFGVLSQVGLLGALAMNVTFYFAAGWTSPSTSSLNLLMIVANVVMFAAFAGKVLSVDQFLYRRLPRLWPRLRRALPEAA